MSRTHRRKNSYLKSWYVTEPRKVDEYDKERYQEQDAKKCSHLMEVRFHQDNDKGTWSVPRDYRKSINKKIKRKNKAQLNQVFKSQEWDGMVTPRFMKDAGYTYF